MTHPRTRELLAKRFGALLATIACGMTLRRFGYGVHLPFLVVKYGGSILWGTMVYFIVASIAARTKASRIVIYAVLIALAVEFFRLLHTPWLDAFRLTTVGALLLGRVFTPWNIVAYCTGIALGLMLDAQLARRSRSR